jgi:hypothetical protein
LKWLLRIFFSATVGFQIPVQQFWTASTIGQALAIFSCITGKLALGLFAFPPLTWTNFLIVGLSMATWSGNIKLSNITNLFSNFNIFAIYLYPYFRGEFAFLIAVGK